MPSLVAQKVKIQVEGGIFDSLSSGGDDFNFDEVIASGALGTLQSQRLKILA